MIFQVDPYYTVEYPKASYIKNYDHCNNLIQVANIKRGNGNS